MAKDRPKAPLVLSEAEQAQLSAIAVAFVAVLHLVTVYRLLTTPVYLTLFGSGPLHALTQLELNSFRYDWSLSLVIFAIHLVLLGYLIFRSGYIPKILGILLALDGFGWLISSLRPYLYPNVHLGFLFTVSFVELLLPLWLVIRGWRIQEPTVGRDEAVIREYIPSPGARRSALEQMNLLR